MNLEVHPLFTIALLIFIAAAIYYFVRDVKARNKPDEESDQKPLKPRKRESFVDSEDAVESKLFWTWIDDGRVAGHEVYHQQLFHLEESAHYLPAQDILAYYNRLLLIRNELMLPGIYAAAGIMMRNIDAERFIQFSSWLIAKGKQTVERAIENPNSLAEVDFNGVDSKKIDDVLLECFYEKTGEQLPEMISQKVPPQITDWTELEFMNRFPDLWKKYRSF